MSAGFSQGFGENQRPSSKVLRPPGGGSSDIFGADNPNTPRTIRNHMASNIFGSTQEAPVKNNGDAARAARAGREGDSYNRLFGGSDRPYTPAKNHLKSNIPLGGDGSPAKPTNGNAVAATNGHSNGKAENNHANGLQNGTSKTEIEASSKDPAPGNSLQAQSVKNEDTKSIHPSDTSKSNDNNTNNAKNEDNNSHSVDNSQSNSEEKSKTTIPKTTKPNEISGESQKTDKLSIAANNNNNSNNNNKNNAGNDATDSNKNTSQKQAIENGEINGRGPNGNTDGGNSDKSSSKDGGASSTTTSSVVSPVSGVSDCTEQSNNSTLSSASDSMQSPRALSGMRNPVTGVGVDMPLYKRTRALRRDGNPVTGEGYNADASASVNGAKHVINKNRIPPGGYSSGLW